jgi:hypothetical protein
MCERPLAADGTRRLQPLAVRIHLAQGLQVDPSIIIFILFYFQKRKNFLRWKL